MRRVLRLREPGLGRGGHDSEEETIVRSGGHAMKRLEVMASLYNTVLV
jgi:hypothetical protein